MNIYLISQDVNNDYDTYDSAVVVANSEEEAKTIHPNGRDYVRSQILFTWTSIDHVKVELIGIANESYKEPCVIVASFNAG